MMVQLQMCGCLRERLARRMPIGIRSGSPLRRQPPRRARPFCFAKWSPCGRLRRPQGALCAASPHITRAAPLHSHKPQKCGLLKNQQPAVCLLSRIKPEAYRKSVVNLVHINAVKLAHSFFKPLLVKRANLFEQHHRVLG